MNMHTHAVATDPIWSVSLALGDDGYTAMDTVRPYGWVPLPDWGPNGADLGRWPYVVIYIRWTNDAFDLAEYIEGDVRQWRLPTRELLDQALDQLAGLWTPTSEGGRA